MPSSVARPRRFRTPRGCRARVLVVLAALVACDHHPPASESPPPEPGPIAVSASAASSPSELAETTTPQIEPEAEPETEPEPEPEPEPIALGPVIEQLESPRRFKHIAVPMETLEQVAARYGLKVSTLRKWNELDEEFRLEMVHKKPKLRIYTKRIPPPRERIEHEVVEGDTWGQLARRYGAASTDIRAYNVRKLGRQLDPGELVQIWIDPVVHAETDKGDNELGLRRGAYSIGSPNEGRLVNAVRIPDSEDYVLGHPNSTWGTTHAVSAVIRAMTDFRARSGFTGRLKIGTMSRQRGGEVGSHKSHQSGRDLDIRLPIKEELPQKLRPEPWRVDWLATWHLIESFAATGDCLIIFFDYKLQRRIAKAATEAGVDPARIDEVLQWPIGSKASRGLVRHEPGHEQHIHVRLTCGPYETECVS